MLVSQIPLKTDVSDALTKGVSFLGDLRKLRTLIYMKAKVHQYSLQIEEVFGLITKAPNPLSSLLD